MKNTLIVLWILFTLFVNAQNVTPIDTKKEQVNPAKEAKTKSQENLKEKKDAPSTVAPPLDSSKEIPAKSTIKKEEPVPAPSIVAPPLDSSKEIPAKSTIKKEEPAPSSPELAPTLSTKPLETVGTDGPSSEELYVLAEQYSHITLIGGPRLSLVSGELAFDSQFGGREGTTLDLNDDFFAKDSQIGTCFGIDAQHSYFRISIFYGYNRSESEGNIDRHVIVADKYLQPGAQVATNIDIHWFYGNIGYTFYARKWGGIGAKLSFDAVFMRLTADVRGYLADDPTNPLVTIELDNNLFIPMPTIGGYFDFSPDDRLFLRVELDFMFYDISKRRLATVLFGIESRYYFVATQEYYGYFKFQYEYFHYDFETNQVDGVYDWHSFLFTIGFGIKF